MSVTTGGPENPRWHIHVARFYGRLWLIRSILRASKFSVLKLIEIVILWVNYTIPFNCSWFWHFRADIFSFSIHSVWLRWLRITDEGVLPVMRTWSILLNKSDLKLCTQFSRSLYLYLFHKISDILHV